MSELFDLIQTSAVGRDYSCSYRLKFNKECKVSEFIDYLLINRSNEWGCVEVKPTTTTTEEGGFTIGRYYEKGSIDAPFTESILNSIITEAVASGGYTNKDYTLYIRHETDSALTETTVSNSKDVIISDERVVYSKWKINCDGYYPYCANCKEEPKGGMSKYCPNCGAKMCLGE